MDTKVTTFLRISHGVREWVTKINKHISRGMSNNTTELDFKYAQGSGLNPPDTLYSVLNFEEGHNSLKFRVTSKIKIPFQQRILFRTFFVFEISP